jgi:hypothetical protein
MIEALLAEGHTGVWGYPIRTISNMYDLMVARRLAERANSLDDNAVATRGKPNVLKKRSEDIRQAVAKAETKARLKAKAAAKRAEQGKGD